MAKLFSIIAMDKPDSVALRAATRPVHLEHARTLGDKLKYGGPFLTDEAEPKPYGSLMIVEAESLAEVEAFAAADPYAKAGLFESVKIAPVGSSLGVWLGL
jgi:uncharacterized protein YciI